MLSPGSPGDRIQLLVSNGRQLCKLHRKLVDSRYARLSTKTPEIDPITLMVANSSLRASAIPSSRTGEFTNPVLAKWYHRTQDLDSTPVELLSPKPGLRKRIKIYCPRVLRYSRARRSPASKLLQL